MTGFSGTALELGGAGTKTLDTLNVHDNTGTGVAVLGNNATLRNSTITANGVGVRLGGNNTVSGNTVTGNATGVSISGANSTLGGTTVAARNVISGNSGSGVVVTQSGGTARIIGNFIGTDAAGTSALPNAGDGIRLLSVGANTIGGPTTAERNVISGNGGNGIFMSLLNTPAPGIVTVQGNFIGTNAAGTAAIPNALNGVEVDAATLSSRAQLTGNVISGNQQTGVFIREGSHHVVQSNSIGTDSSGTISLGNGAGRFEGVFIQDSSFVTIGGDTPALGNVIAHNGNSGVTIDSTVADSLLAVGNTIRLNSIFDNARLGIDLAQTSAEAGFGLVTPNDFNDADNGANRRQNFPVMQVAIAPAAGGLTVVATLNSTPLSAFAVDFYASPACDSRGAGEGQRFVGSATVVTSAAGPGLPGTAVAALSAAPNPPVVGGVITATATNLSTGDTSEFSACMPVS